MKCMSKELLSVLPQRIRNAISKEEPDTLEEIRLRLCRPVIVKKSGALMRLDMMAEPEELSFVINTASRYSPWNVGTMSMGYLTAPGGHRIGVCGEAVLQDGQIKGIRSVTSLCIRVAKELQGVAGGVDLRDSLLIIGPPGSGKTTMLRDLIRRISQENRGQVCVVDERGEIFPHTGGKPCFSCGDHTDILTGCEKERGTEIALRCMGPDWIAVDEITAKQDCEALVRAGWCGVKILATAHASGIEDLRRREIYRPLLETKLFRSVLILGRDKSAVPERMVL